jgi:hypothetical protein
MRLDGAHRENETIGDLTIRQTLSYQMRNFGFTPGQALEIPGLRAHG